MTAELSVRDPVRIYRVNQLNGGVENGGSNINGSDSDGLDITAELIKVAVAFSNPVHRELLK